MELALVVLLPLLFAILALVFGRRGQWPLHLLQLGALVQLLLVCYLSLAASAPKLLCLRGLELFGLDQTNTWLLTLTSLLFACVAVHCGRWYPADATLGIKRGHGPGMSASLFAACMLGLLSMMSMALLAYNLGVLWVAVEATTLASAPIIIFRHTQRSLEAMWKYLLICSVGIGLALFGTLLLASAFTGAQDLTPGLNLSALMAAQQQIDPKWFKAAFIFILAGYGTKMGLAPFHTWLPDAHSEAPAPEPAVLSGALLNCAFLGILRFVQIAPPELQVFCRTLLVALGLCSLLVAALFIIRQRDYKRMLAFSSVEHMGLAVIILGLGMEKLAYLHLCGHSFSKMMLFLLAGNIDLAYDSRMVRSVKGMFGSMPRTATLWVIGLLLICGMPPSPLFVTELLLVLHAPLWLGALVLALLFVVFCGMTNVCLDMVMGSPATSPPEDEAVKAAEGLYRIPMLAAITVLLLGTVLLFFIGSSSLI
jgi:hydrogenase-4 component F